MIRVFQVKRGTIPYDLCFMLMQRPATEREAKERLSILAFCTDLGIALKDDFLFLVIEGNQKSLEVYQYPELEETNLQRLSGAVFARGIGTGSIARKFAS